MESGEETTRGGEADTAVLRGRYESDLAQWAYKDVLSERTVDSLPTLGRNG
jgi:hypothetical protein